MGHETGTPRKPPQHSLPSPVEHAAVLLAITGTKPEALEIAELNAEAATGFEDYLYWCRVASQLSDGEGQSDSLPDRVLAIEARMRPDDWASFPTIDLTGVVTYLLARVDEGICSDPGLALLFACAGELHRRRQPALPRNLSEWT
jgi:hypothetical protein